MLISPLIDPFAIHNIVEDTSPQLGANLDANNQDIINLSNLKGKAGSDLDVYAYDDFVLNVTNAINFIPSGDTNNYIRLQTVANVPEITTVGSCDLKITSSSGEIDFDNENLTTIGTAEIGTNAGSFQCTIHGYLQLTNVGSAYGGGLYFYAGEGQSADFFFYADEGDNNADKWRLSSASSTNEFKILNKVSGSFVDKLKITTAGAVYLPGVYDDSHGGTGRAMYIQSDGQLTCDTSARRFKENIKDLSDTSWIYELLPREADWKNSNIKADPTLIAEEVELINPKLVSYKPEYRYESHKATGPDGEDETESETTEITETNIPDGVHYYKLIVPMLKEIQKLRQEIDALGAT